LISLVACRLFLSQQIPKNLFDEEYGIYTLGDSAQQFWPYYGANFWEDWERPIHTELFETNGDRGFSIDAGIKIFAGLTRAFPQKIICDTSARAVWI